MKVLFFHATAGHPKVAPPLMSQAGNVLRPFNRFLGQAIHTAKQRQTRYQLPWESVRNLLSNPSTLPAVAAKLDQRLKDTLR